MLRVNHPMLQLQVLKLIKSQMPWCGRKWRQSEYQPFYVTVNGIKLTQVANMKVITSIYLNCRPELRDEWLGGSDQDTELEDALVSVILALKAGNLQRLTDVSRKSTHYEL